MKSMREEAIETVRNSLFEHTSVDQIFISQLEHLTDALLASQFCSDPVREMVKVLQNLASIFCAENNTSIESYLLPEQRELLARIVEKE